MPELPEVETVCRGLARVMVGATITDAHLRRPDLRKPFPAGLITALVGQRVLAVKRRAKYWLWDLSNDITILGHLGMSGRFDTTPLARAGLAGAGLAGGELAGGELAGGELAGGELAALGRHDHVVLWLDDGSRIVYHDPRRFGLITMTASQSVASHPLLADIGPEPLEAHFTGKVLHAALAGRSSAIKVVLLDQTVVAGIGNIYASEALHRAGIHPARPAQELSPRVVARLVTTIKAVLSEAVAAGGSTLQDHRQVDGALGYFQHRFGVYDRAGQPCPTCHCDLAATGGIQRIVQTGRSTFFCAVKQG